MRNSVLGLVVASMCVGLVSQASSSSFVEYYRDNLFLGLAYHLFGFLSNLSTIQSNQDYDGFTTQRYCTTGATSKSVPNAEWYDWNYATGKAQLDSCGTQTNNYYGTPNYAGRSTTCSYNILTNCNSDCWIRRFSICQGKQVGTISPGCR